MTKPPVSGGGGRVLCGGERGVPGTGRGAPGVAGGGARIGAADGCRGSCRAAVRPGGSFPPGEGADVRAERSGHTRQGRTCCLLIMCL